MADIETFTFLGTVERTHVFLHGSQRTLLSSVTLTQMCSGVFAVMMDAGIITQPTDRVLIFIPERPVVRAVLVVHALSTESNDYSVQDLAETFRQAYAIDRNGARGVAVDFAESGRPICFAWFDLDESPETRARAVPSRRFPSLPEFASPIRCTCAQPFRCVQAA